MVFRETNCVDRPVERRWRYDRNDRENSRRYRPGSYDGIGFCGPPPNGARTTTVSPTRSPPRLLTSRAGVPCRAYTIYEAPIILLLWCCAMDVVELLLLLLLQTSVVGIVQLLRSWLMWNSCRCRRRCRCRCDCSHPYPHRRRSSVGEHIRTQRHGLETCGGALFPSSFLGLYGSYGSPKLRGRKGHITKATMFLPRVLVNYYSFLRLAVFRFLLCRVWMGFFSDVCHYRLSCSS